MLLQYKKAKPWMDDPRPSVIYSDVQTTELLVRFLCVPLRYVTWEEYLLPKERNTLDN